MFTYFFLYFSSSELPGVIDPTVAVKSFRAKFSVLLNLIRHCLLSLATALFAESLIHEDVYDEACNETLSSDSRGVAVLNCIKDRIEAVPSDFTKIVSILKSEPFLREIADELVQNYCKYMWSYRDRCDLI